MSDITWSTETRKLSELIPWEKNPRTITQGQAERLVESVEEFGQVETLAIGPDNEIYNGHQRQWVLAQDDPDMVVDVRVASRPLTEDERKKLTIYLHKGAAGEWDFDVLANEFEVDELLEWGFDDIEDIVDAIELTGIEDAQQKDRNLGDKAKQIKPVIYVDEIQDFEKAIALTGEHNRGKAVIEICRYFINGKTEGQFDIALEDFA